MKRFNNKGLTMMELLVSLTLISLVLVFLMSLLANITSEKSGISSDRVEAMLNQAEIVKDIQEKLAGESVYSISYFFDSPDPNTPNNYPSDALAGYFANKTLIIINYRDSMFQTGFVLISVSSTEVAVNKFDNTSVDALLDSINNLFINENKTTWHSTFDASVAAYDYENISIYTYNSTAPESVLGIFENEVTADSFAKIRIPYTFIGGNDKFYDRSYDIEITLYNPTEKITVNRLWKSDYLSVNAESGSNAGTITKVKAYLEDEYGYEVCDKSKSGCPSDASSDSESVNSSYISIIEGDKNDSLIVNLDCKYEANYCPWTNLQRNIQAKFIENEIVTRVAPELTNATVNYDSKDFNEYTIRSAVATYFKDKNEIDSSQIQVAIQNNKIEVIIPSTAVAKNGNSFANWWNTSLNGFKRLIYSIGVENAIRNDAGWLSIPSFSVQTSPSNAQLTHSQTEEVKAALNESGYVVASMTSGTSGIAKKIYVTINCNASSETCPTGVISTSSTNLKLEWIIRSALPLAWDFATIEITYSS